MEMWNESSGTFESVAIPSVTSDASSSNSDNALPPLYGATTVTFHVFLDLENPLSVPRWVKTGDVDDWLQTMFGVSATIKNGVNGSLVKREEGSENRGWEGKITVVDPDPVRRC
jgi:20S proteasome subunit alpha 6